MVEEGGEVAEEEGGLNGELSVMCHQSDNNGTSKCLFFFFFLAVIFGLT